MRGLNEKGEFNVTLSFLILATCGIVNIRFLPYFILKAHQVSKHSVIEEC